MKKILTVLCFLFILFIAGMMIRRFYDNYYHTTSMTAAGPLHRVVEAAEEVPEEFKKLIKESAHEAAQQAPQGVPGPSGSLRP